MVKQSIPRKFWYVIIPIIIFYFIKNFAEIVGMFINMLTNTLFGAFTDTDILSSDAFIQGTIGMLISSVACILLSVYILTPMWKEAKEQLPIQINKDKPLILAIGTIIIYCGIKFLTSYFLHVTYLSEHPTYLPVIEAFHNRSTLEMFVRAVIVAPIVEELLCRGVIQNRLMTFMKPRSAVLLQSIIFGIIHMNPIQALYAGLSGIIYGMLYVRFRKLWPCILAHAVFNSYLADWIIKMISYVVDEITLTHILIIGSIFFIIGAFILLKQPAAQAVDEAIEEELNDVYQLLSHAYH
ncbi:MAG: CPBP family intramembrane metalloprotease [Oscillospiraceae bacterium]|nr:CPBP family intramembrane metalloprotease [Oscillospiraceae bacterium]